MLAEVHTGTVVGIDPVLVRVEVNLSSGLPAFTVVGLAQGSVREGRERVGAALRNTGFALPPKRITVNLAPADVRKDGTALDLPIAIGLLGAGATFDGRRLARAAFLGELGLDGSLRGVAGVLPIAAACERAGLETLYVPSENATEGALVQGLRVLGARTLRDVVDDLSGRCSLEPAVVNAESLLEHADPDGLDLADVCGQATAKRVLEIAAAGSHNVLFVGPPGSGKTMLARRLSGILPPMSLEEALDTTRVYSVAGRLRRGQGLMTFRPFRAPHQSVSEAGLTGGGAPLRPGEISLAHHGVLFLDELAEFRRGVLESLRQPLEDGVVTLARARASLRFPARFILVAAMNPCPCGYHGDGTDRCLCDPSHVLRYRGRVSGPLMDRIDLHLHVPAVPLGRLETDGRGESSRTVRERVRTARAAQVRRFTDTEGTHANGQMGSAEVRRWCRLEGDAARLLRAAVERTGMSARGYHRVLKVARTIADLAGVPELRVEHVAEALQFRMLDRGQALR